MAKKRFAGDMWAVFNYGNPNERYQRFLQSGRPRFSSFLESIILHDGVVVPTDDYMSLAVLIGVLGEGSVLRLLDSGALGFLRMKGALAYVGNGGGLQSYELRSGDDKMAPLCAPADEAIAWAIGGLNTKVDVEQVTRKVLDATCEISLSTIKDVVQHETHMDVLNSPYLRAQFAIRNREMNRLAGIEANQVRIYGGPDSGDSRSDEIATVLKLAHANVELRAAEIAGCDDSSTSSPIGHMLKAKQERTGVELPPGQAFSVLCEISGLPDVGDAVLSGRVKVRQLLRLRNSRSGVQFRRWFHENCRQDPLTTA